MKRSSRILHYQLIPVLIFGIGYPLLRVLGGPQVEVAGAGVDLYAFLLALAMALFPIIVVSQLVHHFRCPGFAILRNGEAATADDLGLRQLLMQVEQWVLFEQPLSAEIGLAGRHHDIYARFRIPRRLLPDAAGRRLARHIAREPGKVIAKLDQKALEALYRASQQNPEMAAGLDGTKLINDDELEVVKSMLLSALEIAAPEGVAYPNDHRVIMLDKKVRKVARVDPRVSNEDEEMFELEGEV